jgi:hypothetical protein
MDYAQALVVIDCRVFEQAIRAIAHIEFGSSYAFCVVPFRFQPFGFTARMFHCSRWKIAERSRCIPKQRR